MKILHGRVFNYRPDLPDQRDILFKPPALSVSDQVDLTPLLPLVMDQGASSSCTWNAICCVLGYIQLMQLRAGKGGPEEYDPRGYIPPSRLFGFFQARAFEGSENSPHVGAYVRDGIKASARMGVCRESLWPYVDSNVCVNPTVAAYQDAASFRISSYSRLNALQDLLSCLSQSSPIVFGFSCYSSFMSVKGDGLIAMPSPTETLLGGHSCAIVGYNQATRYFTIRNSYGTGWGDKGNGYMSFDFINKYANDFWTIKV